MCYKSAAYPLPKPMKRRYQALKGTKDILPAEARTWSRLEQTVRDVFSRYGFGEIRTPIIESSELFARSVGASSDIVRKEMYTFPMGEQSISLRPENTASVVRAFVEHSLHRQVATGFPERYFYMGPMFRHERPQRGRQRQFHQIGAEVLGAAEPLADAETIQMVELLLQELGIKDRELTINSVGDPACRPAHREALKAWLAGNLERLCEDCRRRYDDNPMRVFDCKVEADRELLTEAPTMLERLCEPCRTHFDEVRRDLDSFEIPYTVDPRIVRGLDYYQRTVFEFLSSGLGSQNAILGGGRYDGLVEELGGPAIPGFGFAVGMERLILLMESPQGKLSDVDLALISLGSDAMDAAVEMASRFRRVGIRCVMPLVDRPMGAQLRRANKSGARYALFIGGDELARKHFGLKDLQTGTQETVDESSVIERFRTEGIIG